MLPFTLITEYRRPVALILEDNPAPDQLTTLFALVPDNALCASDLAKRWNVRHVFCPREWADAQLKRIPMLRPKGQRLAFL